MEEKSKKGSRKLEPLPDPLAPLHTHICEMNRVQNSSSLRPPLHLPLRILLHLFLPLPLPLRSLPAPVPAPAASSTPPTRASVPPLSAPPPRGATRSWPVPRAATPCAPDATVADTVSGNRTECSHPLATRPSCTPKTTVAGAVEVAVDGLALVVAKAWWAALVLAVEGKGRGWCVVSRAWRLGVMRRLRVRSWRALKMKSSMKERVKGSGWMWY